MTNIGIVRKMDSLGRIVIPKEFRRVFKLDKNDEIEILATEEGILLRLPDIEVRRRSIQIKESWYKNDEIIWR